MKRPRVLKNMACLLVLGTSPLLTYGQGFSATEKPAATIWVDRGDPATLNLVYGVGRSDRAPNPDGRYVFVSEVLSGRSPKFDAKDDQGVMWRVKLGPEARTETAAARLLWGTGYFAEEHYYLPKIHVEGVPQKFLSPDGTVSGVRMERRDPKEKLGEWSWNDNPFIGTQEFNGLRVMMALLNNWDLKTSNNAIVQVDGETRYLVSDVGATFGRTGGVFDRTKGLLDDYSQSKFIDHIETQEVDLTLKGRPFFLMAFVDLYHYQKLWAREKVGNHIPRDHAKWLGQRLAQLSTDQIRDCFRSAGFSELEVQGYTDVVRERITDLNGL